jgi:hypothetical protein
LSDDDYAGWRIVLVPLVIVGLLVALVLEASSIVIERLRGRSSPR